MDLIDVIENGEFMKESNYLINHVRTLLEEGADPNIMKNDSILHADSYSTPLSNATQQRYPVIARLLLDRWANPNVVDKYGLTPLIRASGAGSFEIVKY